MEDKTFLRPSADSQSKMDLYPVYSEEEMGSIWFFGVVDNS